MEKIKANLFASLSCLNLLLTLYLGQGKIKTTMVLGFCWVALVLNHFFLVSIVKNLSQSAQGGKPSSPGKLLGLFVAKFMMLFMIVGVIFVYDQTLIPKLFLIIFFQLIIQVVSIKNNNLN